ncbi:MAG: hypothetical protein HGA87_07960, partial [Desulfobulbaceae bacterium]|nr:hypothetical protein [Desulfobulbaceae bacterium]
MTIKFRLIPRQNISSIGEDECWNIIGLPARLELQPQQFPLPFGWVLLRGVLHRRGQDYSARLIAEVGGVDQPYHFFPLPVSRKGTILELIYLPKGVLRLVLEPMQSHGQFQLVELSIKPVGHMERIGKMVNRVVPLLFKYPYEQRHRSGLRLHTPVTNLHKAIMGPSGSGKSTLKKLLTGLQFDRLC